MLYSKRGVCCWTFLEVGRQLREKYNVWPYLNSVCLVCACVYCLQAAAGSRGGPDQAPGLWANRASISPPPSKHTQSQNGSSVLSSKFSVFCLVNDYLQTTLTTIHLVYRFNSSFTKFFWVTGRTSKFHSMCVLSFVYSNIRHKPHISQVHWKPIASKHILHLAVALTDCKHHQI